ncbi:MAG: hypothetical protein K9W44_11275 [Candidatus Lokiarchaeota archaeon]|nr:hypothetical protein [Candidatus Harpocratesius repetitus]
METQICELTCLLREYYGDYYIPENWEESPKSVNYIAKITRGEKFIFDRNFLRTYTLDGKIVFKKSNFNEGDIIEQKCVFKRGSKEEVLFHGFFVVHFHEKKIYGEEISQKDALEYFDLKEKLPDLDNSQHNKLKMKIGSVLRKLAIKYGEETVVNILAEIIDEYFPSPQNSIID